MPRRKTERSKTEIGRRGKKNKKQIKSTKRTINVQSKEKSPSVARGGRASCITTAIQLLVPLCMTALFAMFLVSSFWPVFLVVIPFSMRYMLAIPAVAAIYVFFFSRHKFLKAWALFLLPWHGLFFTLIIAVFSFWWSLAIGALLFVQGEVLWDHSIVIRRWDALLEWFDVRSKPIFEYFPMTYSLSSSLRDKWVPRKKEKYMFTYHPHGVYCFGLFTMVFGKTSGFKKHFPQSKGVLVGVANALLHIPVVGTLFSYFGFIPASKKSLEEACASQYDVTIVPGGIAEMTKYSPTEEVVFLKSRRGFIKLAMEQGRTIVPVYGFGENNTFTVFRWFQRLREKLSRQFKISLVLFRGRGPTLIPHQVPIEVVCGEPMRVPQIFDPSEDIVQEYLERYIQRVKELYKSHQHLHPYCKKRPLLVL